MITGDLDGLHIRKETSTKGPRTRAAILEAAALAFSTSGYEITTLEQIAEKLSVSRGTVLFHFESKRALLLEIVQPLFRSLEVVIGEFEPFPVPLTARLRRQLLTRYCDVLNGHRPATILLVRDLTTIIQMHWPDGGPEITNRFMALLQGHHPDDSLRLRSAATVGAILRPMAMPPIDPALLDAEARQLVVNCALAAYAAS
jgi:AcrR family transcriptional regulator